MSMRRRLTRRPSKQRRVRRIGLQRKRTSTLNRSKKCIYIITGVLMSVSDSWWFISPD